MGVPNSTPHERGVRGRSAVLLLGLVLPAMLGISLGARAAGATAPVESEVQKLGALPAVGGPQVTLSPDGTRIACVLRQGNKDVVSCDGEVLGEYDAVRGLKFSPDGRRLGYAASRDRAWFVVIDGKEGDKFTSLVGPAFSPNGKHLAYVTGLGGQRQYLVCDGVPQMKYTAVGQEEPVFSPDSRHVAYEARTSGTTKRTTVRDPDRPPVPNEPPPSWVTPDGHEVDVQEDHIPRTYFMVRDGRKGERANDVQSPVFSPNSRILAYAARFANKWFIVVDDRKAGKLYDALGAPVFSADNRKLAYPAKLKDKWFVVCGRKQEEGEFDEVRGLCFSDDGTLMAYAAREGNKWCVVCEGKKGPAHDDVAWVGFSPDAKHLAYTARRGGRWLMVTDGLEGLPHGRVLVPAEGSRTIEKFRYVALDVEARLVEIPWPAETDWTNGLK